MPMEAEDLDEMKTLLAVARKRDLSFAVCMGKKPENTVFLMHRKKAGEMLGRTAKKQGETPKVTWGLVRIKGKNCFLTLETDPVPNMARALRVFFKDQGSPLKVQILDAAGGVLESDGEEEEDGVVESAGAVPEQMQEAPQERGTAAAQDDAPAAREAASEPATEPEPPAREAATQETAPQTAEAPAEEPRETAAEEAGDEAADEKAERWKGMEAPMRALFDQAMQDRPPNADKLEAAWTMATERARTGDYDAAMKIAARLEPSLKSVAEKKGADEGTGARKPEREAAGAENTVAQPQAPNPDHDHPRRWEWDTNAPEVTKLLEAALQNGLKDPQKFTKAWKMANDRVAQGDYDAALTILWRIEPTLRSIAPDGTAAAMVYEEPVATSAPQTAASDGSGSGGDEPATEAPQDGRSDPNAAIWLRLINVLEPMYYSTIDGNPENRGKLEAAWALAHEKVDAGDWATAVKIAQRLAPLLTGGSAGGGDDIPTNVVDIRSAQVAWRKTRSTMFKEMEKLQKAIRSACQGDPALSSIIPEVETLGKKLEAFDEGLERILDDLTNAEDSAKRDRLKRDAEKQIKDYRKLLESDFFKEVDGNNGFVKVNIAGAANSSLGRIEKVLAG